MHGQKPVHGTPKYDCPHYGNPTNIFQLMLNMWWATRGSGQSCKQIDLKGGTDSLCVVSCGGQRQPCMGGHLCMEPSCQTHDKQCEGHASANPDACERRVRLPICGYSWGDSHAWTDNFAWNPHAWLSALLKLNKQMLTYAKHKISNPWSTQSVHKEIYIEGATDFHCAVSHGGQPCMGGHLCNFVFTLFLLQTNIPASQWFPPSGKHPEQRILVTTANCRLYSNISQILLLYKRGGIKTYCTLRNH